MISSFGNQTISQVKSEAESLAQIKLSSSNTKMWLALYSAHLLIAQRGRSPWFGWGCSMAASQSKRCATNSNQLTSKNHQARSKGYSAFMPSCKLLTEGKKPSALITIKRRATSMSKSKWVSFRMRDWTKSTASLISILTRWSVTTTRSPSYQEQLIFTDPTINWNNRLPRKRLSSERTR